MGDETSVGAAEVGRGQQRAVLVQGVLLLALLITLFLSQPIFTGRPLVAADLLFALDPLWQPLAPADFDVPANQVLSDQVFEFYPWQHFIREELAQGRVPLWNPYVNSGHPLLANAQSAIFDPLNVVARLWPLAQSFAVLAWLRLFCAGTLMLLLALELRLSRWGAYLAMVVFTFALPQVVWLLYPKASVLVWVPGLLYFSLRVLRRGRWRDVGALGLVIGAQMVGGHPETALFSALLWVAFCAYWVWRVDVVSPAGRGRAWWQLGVAGGLGLGAGAVQWLPTAEALLQSEILAARSAGGLTWAVVFGQWREWLAAVTMLLPDFFGNPRHYDYWFPFSNYTEQTLYVGILPLACALLVMWGGRTWGRAVAFWAGVGLVAWALALRVPPLPLVAEVPPLSVMNMGRLRHVYMLAVALLAGYGLDAVVARMAQGDGRAVRRMMALLLALGGVAALAAGAAWGVVAWRREDLVAMARAQASAAQGNPFFYRAPEEYLALADLRVAQMLASFQPTNWGMYWPLLLALVMGGLVVALWRVVRRPDLRAQVLAVVVLALTVGDLWRVGMGYNVTVVQEAAYPTPPLVAELLRLAPPGAGSPYRVVGTGLALVPNVSMVYGLEDVRGYDPIAPQRYMALVSRARGAVRVGHHLLFAQADAPLLDLLGVRYAFSAEALGARWEAVAADNGVTLYRNPAALPRAFMVYRSEVAASPEASLAMTLDPGFDARNVVIVEGEDAPRLQDQDPPARAPLVEITHYTPGAMTVAVESAQPGLLVMGDPYVPGWVAQVDGKATAIWVANHALRAVLVPEGAHVVTMTYRPLSFVVGAWVSGVSMVGLVLLVVGGLMGRRGGEHGRIIA